MQENDPMKQSIPGNETELPKSDEGINLSPRGSGILFCVIGLVGTYFGIVSPYMAALHHAASIQLWDKLIVAGPGIFMFSLPYLFFPSKAVQLFGDPRSRSKPTVGGWVFIIAAVGVGFLAMFLLKNNLTALGYGGKGF